MKIIKHKLRILVMILVLAQSVIWVGDIGVIRVDAAAKTTAVSKSKKNRSKKSKTKAKKSKAKKSKTKKSKTKKTKTKKKKSGDYRVEKVTFSLSNQERALSIRKLYQISNDASIFDTINVTVNNKSDKPVIMDGICVANIDLYEYKSSRYVLADDDYFLMDKLNETLWNVSIQHDATYKKFRIPPHKKKTITIALAGLLFDNSHPNWWQAAVKKEDTQVICGLCTVKEKKNRFYRYTYNKRLKKWDESTYYEMGHQYNITDQYPIAEFKVANNKISSQIRKNSKLASTYKSSYFYKYRPRVGKLSDKLRR